MSVWKETNPFKNELSNLSIAKTKKIALKLINGEKWQGEFKGINKDLKTLKFVCDAGEDIRIPLSSLLWYSIKEC